MDLTVLVTDAAGAPLTAATVVIRAADGTRQGLTGPAGDFIAAQLSYGRCHVSITRASYLDEEVAVVPAASGSAIWDNPVCQWDPPATLKVRLSRIQAAPTLGVSNSDLEQRAAYDPKAAFTWIDQGGNPTRRYLGTYNDVVGRFMPVSHPILPRTPTEGWGRINHGSNPVSVDPSRHGSLVWLEWGIGSGTPRLLVSVWVPKWRGASPSTLDVVVFFSPNTATKDYPADAYPWRRSYPYSAVKGAVPLRPGGSTPLVQPYLALAHRYLFFEKWLIQQLMAARRRAIVVFPVQPYGTWGPFGQVAGLARLVTEITHYIHRTGLDQSTSDTDQDVAPTPRQRFARVGIQTRVPSVRRIVLSGFSAGMAPVVGMLGTQIGERLTSQSAITHDMFGADVNSFLQAWGEVWDHDAPHGVRQQMDQALPRWLGQVPNRMARCYQSDHTGSRGWIDSSPLASQVSAPSRVVQAGPADAAERHADPKCSLVFFGQGYLHHTTSRPADPPAFWLAPDDHHQAVPLVTFGHAALLSGLAQP